MRPKLIFPTGSGQQMPRVVLIVRLALFAMAVALFSPIRSNAYSTYSLAIVRSDGSVVGDAITDGTPPPGTNMNHTAYATATLTSPKGRKSVNNTRGTNTTRAEVLLPFDPTDLGTYLEASIHSVYCPCMGMFINCVPSQTAALLRMTQYAALTSDNTTTDICGYKIRERTYRGLDTYGWIPNTEYWKLNEAFTLKDGSCGQIGIDGSNGQDVGFPDEIKIRCANPTSCVYETNQTFSVAPIAGLPLTQVPGKDCVGITDPAQCYAHPSHTGWHVRATATSITVTDN